MKTPFTLPVRIEDDNYIVAADCELIMTNYDATPEELKAIVTMINGFHEVMERLEAMQRIIGELASTNPFLVGEFEKNKTVLEKLK